MTGKIFLKLIGGVVCLLLLAAVSVDYFATEVTADTYIQNLTAAAHREVPHPRAHAPRPRSA